MYRPSISWRRVNRDWALGIWNTVSCVKMCKNLKVHTVHTFCKRLNIVSGIIPSTFEKVHCIHGDIGNSSCKYQTSACCSKDTHGLTVQNYISPSLEKIGQSPSSTPVLLCRNIHRHSLLSHILYPRSLPCVRFFSSALFITNEKLAQLCPSASPLVDVQSVLDNEKNIVENLKKRKLNSSEYDFTHFSVKHKEFVSIDETIKALEFKLIHLDEFLRENKTKLDPAQVEAKQIERKHLKSEIKKFDDFILDYQKNVILKILKLPNDLDVRTPLEYEIISEHKPEATAEKTDSNALDKYVRFSNRLDIHYLGDAAKFEYLLPIVLKQYFSEKQNFIPFTNTDLCKGVIVEGCGTPYLCPYNNIVLVNNETKPGDLGYDEWRFHLVGGGAMDIFCAYHTNHGVHVKDLPVKSVTSGKTYGFRNLVCNHLQTNTTNKEASVEFLYNSLQKETINLFIGTDSAENLHISFEHLQSVLESVFQSLHIGYRICRAPAHALHASESLQIEFQVFSDRLNAWVTCGDVCLNNDYISKRLAMCFSSSVTSYERNYLHVLNANVYINVILVYLLETNRNLNVELVQKGLEKLS